MQVTRVRLEAPRGLGHSLSCQPLGEVEQGTLLLETPPEKQGSAQLALSYPCGRRPWFIRGPKADDQNCISGFGPMPFWTLTDVLVWPRFNLASITLGAEAAWEELDLSAGAETDHEAALEAFGVFDSRHRWLLAHENAWQSSNATKRGGIGHTT